MAATLDAAPDTQVLGDAPEPVRYALMRSTSAEQWTATWQGSFFYQGRSDLDAYEAALRDHHFGLVFLDTSRVGVPGQPCGAFCVADSLIPQMESFGYVPTSTIRNEVGQQWTVWRVATT